MIHDENEALRQELEALRKDVPPMPEGLHQRWMKAVEESPMQHKPSQRTPWKRALAVAAAAVFVIGGTLLTRDLDLGQPMTKNAHMTAEYAMDVDGAYDGGYGGYSAGTAQNTVYMARSAAPESAPMDTAAQEQTQKIIRTVSLRMGTRTYDDSLAALKQGCADAGGWIASLTENGGDVRTAYLTLRIPAGQLDAFLEGAGGWGRMISRSESTEDVTESYYDTKARLDTQQALMDRLRSLVDAAQELSDVLALEAQMAETQYEIDRLTASLQSTDRQVDYATVSVTLREETAGDDAENSGLSLGERLMGALNAGWDAFAGFVQDAAVFLVSALPFLAVAAVAAVLFHLIRRWRK